MWRRIVVVFIGFLALAAFLGGPVPIAQAATFTVDSTGDASDFSTVDGVCDTDDSVGDGPCTLRAAMEQANATGGTDSINFSILPAGVQTIAPGSALSIVTDTVTIDGTTQPGFVGTPIIELDGTSAGAANGLVIFAGADGSTVRGLVINRFSRDGINLAVGGSNIVEGNFIGTDVTGTLDLGNNLEGVRITSSSSGNTIGGTTAAARNVISGNGESGVRLSSGTGNVVQGNFIGTDVTGTLDLGNRLDGVRIQSPGNTIGGTAAGAGNVISGNDDIGVNIIGALATGNTVAGNFIGTDISGTLDVGNSSDGVRVTQGASSNTIGGTAAAARNVISGNDRDGVLINGSGTTGNMVQGNFIGTDVTGTLDLGNSLDGVEILKAPSNTIGGTAAGASNVISGNQWIGVLLNGSGATGNMVQGNFIGTDVTGTVALGNSLDGVKIKAPGNTIGGTAAGATNVISGNGINGILLGLTATGNTVAGNFIGTDVTGTVALGNTSHGVQIFSSASNNTIGGTAAGAGNTIAFSGGDGVRVSGATSTGNDIRGNSIHSNVGKGIENITGGNTELAPPTVTASGSASGTSSCLNCDLDVSSDAADEGKVFEGSTTTDGSGDWSFAGAVVGPNVTATVTDGSGNTSEFSSTFACDDFDSDGICDSGDPDDDGDGIEDDVESPCGSDPLDALSIPERVDGAFAGVDDDGNDGADEALPGGASGFDCDGDGYTGTAEDNVYSYIGQTDGDQKTCQEYDAGHANANADIDPSLRWPSDFNKAVFPLDSFNKITILDLTSFLAPVKYFGTNFGTNPDDVRWDLSKGPGIFPTDINILDLTTLIAGSSGNPPMLGGAKALGGPVCPFAP